MLLACVMAACTTDIDLSKEAAASGPSCAHDTPAPPVPAGTSSPFVRIDRIVDLPDSLETTSIATDDGLTWALARDGELVAFFLVAVDSAGSEVHRWPLPGWPWSLHVASDHALTLDLRDGALMRVNLVTGEVRRLPRFAGQSTGLAVSTDGRRAYQTLVTTAEIRVIDVLNGRHVCTLPVVSGVRPAITLSRDGVRLFVGYGGGGGSLYHAGIEVLDRATGETLGLLSTGAEIGHLSLSPDEELLVALTGRQLITIDPASMTEDVSTPLPDQGDGVIWHDGFAYVWSYAQRAIWVVDPQLGRITATIDLPIRPNGLAADRDAAYASGARMMMLRRSDVDPPDVP